MNDLLVHKIIPFSNVDGPGNRYAIFLHGCNFDCTYCHNPETIGKCNSCLRHIPHQDISISDNHIPHHATQCLYGNHCFKMNRECQHPMSWWNTESLLEEIKKYKFYIRGVTVSGGEPTLQYEALTNLFRSIKLLGLSRFVDTNGSLPLENYSELVKESDQFMLDVKSFDEKEHFKLTGRSNKNTINNLYYLKKIGKLYEVRTVIAPGLLDSEYTVEKVSDILKGSDVIYKLLRYRPNGVRNEHKHLQTPTDTMMQSLLDKVIAKGIRGFIAG